MAESGADQYIGSLISLTSKSEIRYEGLLYTVDTENSNIALQNVRSFGTEGRKNDGPQIPASDKVYEFIIFRGSDIKDLQVKTSPPLLPIHNDPAIISIQAESSRNIATPPRYMASPAETVMGNATSGHYNHSVLPYHHPISSDASLWASSRPPLDPMTNTQLYWPTLDAQTASIPQAFPWKTSFPPQLPPDSSLTQPEALVSSPLPVVSAAHMNSTSLTVNHSSSESLIASKITPTHISNKESDSVDSSTTVMNPITSSLSSVNPMPLSSTPKAHVFREVATSSLDSHHETKRAPVQPARNRRQFGNGKGSTTDQSYISQKVGYRAGKAPILQKQVYRPVQVGSRDSLKTGDHQIVSKSQPLLPLPLSFNQYQPLIQAHDRVRSNPNRRGWGRGNIVDQTNRPGSKVLEDFDFIAMNAKFNKQEVWDELLKGKSTERHFMRGRNLPPDCVDGATEIKDAETPIKSVYVKDDFFDSLSYGALDHEHGKPEHLKFSEQQKIDKETFGNIRLRNRYQHGNAHREGRGGHSGHRLDQSMGRGNNFRYQSIRNEGKNSKAP